MVGLDKLEFQFWLENFCSSPHLHGLPCSWWWIISMSSFLFLVNNLHLGILILGLLSTKLLLVLTNISSLRGWNVIPLSTTHLQLLCHLWVETKYWVKFHKVVHNFSGPNLQLQISWRLMCSASLASLYCSHLITCTAFITFLRNKWVYQQI